MIPTEPVPPINLAESDQFFGATSEQNVMYTAMGSGNRPHETGGDEDDEALSGAPSQQIMNSVADHHEHSYSLPYHVSDNGAVRLFLFFLA